MTERLILASGSRFRRAILENAGIDFDVETATVDERAVEAPLQDAGLTAEDVAAVLAEAKAGDVSEGSPTGWSSAVTRRCRLATRSCTSPRTWRLLAGNS